MRKGLKRKTYQNLPSLICVEFCPYLGLNHRHHDLKESALRPRPTRCMRYIKWGGNFPMSKSFDHIFLLYSTRLEIKKFLAAWQKSYLKMVNKVIFLIFTIISNCIWWVRFYNALWMKDSHNCHEIFGEFCKYGGIYSLLFHFVYVSNSAI